MVRKQISRSFVLATFLALLFSSTSVKKVDPKSLDCLSKVIYHESRGEPIVGQKAVAHVVINRLNSPDFPKSVCAVVYQPSQFENIKSAKPDTQSKAWEIAKTIALEALTDTSKDPTNGATYFYAQNKIKPKWAKGDKIIIGNHTFVKV